MTKPSFATPSKNLSSLIKPFAKRASQIFILTDSNVAHHCLPYLIANTESLNKAEIIEVEPGEEAKSLEICEGVWNTLLEKKADRNALLICLGGGVVTDLGGFVASTFKRGIPFLHLPTSLLGMVDAAIGGKTGIDFQNVKNAIGTFALPEAILIDPQFLSTLPKMHWMSGFAEMIKHALVCEEAIWTKLKKINTPSLNNIQPHIKGNVQIKEKITFADFKEVGPRQLLNFGHTIGHALESHFMKMEMGISHGSAVALGMMVETEISFLKGYLSESLASEIVSQLKVWYPTHAFSFPNWEQLSPFLKNDKKNKVGSLRFTLLEGVGKGIVEISVSSQIAQAAYQKILIA